MLIVVSPAKSLDMTPASPEVCTQPALKSKANALAKILKDYNTSDLQELMHISPKLAEENYRRYQGYKTRVTTKSAKRAVDTFVGDVYRGLDVSDFTPKDYDFAQDHLRILSGLYGILRPLDLMQPYRLEMGTKLANDAGTNLYHYWGDLITKEINKELKNHKESVLLNLASDEYFKSVKKDQIKGRIVVANFKEWRDDKLKFISFSAKVARGLMSRYVIKNRIDKVEDIKGFDYEGYSYSEEHSTEDNWLFVR